MNGVTAKIAQKVAVLFEHNHIDAGASEQISGHHTRGATAHDTNAGVNPFGCLRVRRLIHDSTLL